MGSKSHVHKTIKRPDEYNSTGNRSQLWVRYLMEAAEMIVADDDGHSLHFRKFRSGTMVYSLDLNYYTEVNRVLNMTEHFKDFMLENFDALQSMSYKK